MTESPVEAVGRLEPVGDYAPAAELLRALASPLRIAIVMRLDTGALCVHELVDALGVPQPLVSQHLRVLRGAGVVESHRRGREVAYSLTDAHVAHVVRDAVAHAAHAPGNLR
ncbi:ArsR/SmtB family transcription factor [Cryptosporangium phraense]|uniref:Winged helix-turn-helix transcriptional regulator n=1 Tax=Cryptosporangium phraense TaxID=2593070 RepID=A0A545AHI3_9ACTN|nr:metalloregulator ArsR/SmtB family transcription factor [Cryptosporangium phraense]TQS40783.1 winged helix-turn-helix transcriptional regulator [Cryptosporangium phraense]